MTIVVYDGKMLAADSRTTYVARNHETPPACPDCGSTKSRVMDSANKVEINFGKATFCNSRVLAIAGAGSKPEIEKFTKVLRQGGNFDEIARVSKLVGITVFESSTFIIVTESSVHKVINRHQGMEIETHSRDAQLAVGSSDFAALFIMKELGHNAIDAIAGCNLVDKGTGGAINYVDLTLPELKVEGVFPINAPQWGKTKVVEAEVVNKASPAEPTPNLPQLQKRIAATTRKRPAAKNT